MANLRQTVDQQEMEESVVEATTTQRSAAFPPRTRLPVEVWRMIFSTMCLSMCDYMFDSDRYSPDSPLLGLPTLVVSQVCSHWRRIVEGMPRLWATINLNFSRLNYKPNILEIYLVNSGSCPFTLRLETENDGSTGGLMSRTLDLWAILSAHIHKMGEFISAMLGAPHAFSLPPIPNLSLPHLERYEEEGLFDPQASWDWFWQAIMEAPNVATFITTLLCPRETAYSSRLTSWTIYLIDFGRDVDILLDVLQECASLRSLTLSNVRGADSGWPVPVREVKVPSLRDFFISGTPHIDGLLSGIFYSLKLPSLQSLYIVYPEWPLPSALLDMIRCSSKSLKTLCVRLTPLWDAVSSQDPLLLDILQTTPELTHFMLWLGSPEVLDEDDEIFVDEMISPLISELKNKSHYLLPKLGSMILKLPDYLIDAELVQRFMEVVSARQRTPNPLRELRLVHYIDEDPTPEGEEEEEGFNISDEPELLEQIRVLEDGGAKVVVEPRYGGYHG
ncbi:hypothetical protein L218DRAFT_1031774 [Marasmius fiardii PR-910]|nr:hypothetical protein L218DRAFT_1031774 [Marasmius fiardii PR-910]